MIRSLTTPRQPVKLDVSLAIVNIVLLLILFFLATGQLLNPQTGDVDLAETQELPIDALPSPILIIDGDTWELEGTTVAPDLIDVALSDLPQPVVLHVLIARDAPASGLLEVMNTPGLSDVELRLVTLRTRDRPQ
ncbi:MAG: biopolymer transporter ExbD [Pseudomonadota bacterium]